MDQDVEEATLIDEVLLINDPRLPRLLHQDEDLEEETSRDQKHHAEVGLIQHEHDDDRVEDAS